MAFMRFRGRRKMRAAWGRVCVLSLDSGDSLEDLAFLVGIVDLPGRCEGGLVVIERLAVRPCPRCEPAIQRSAISCWGRLPIFPGEMISAAGGGDQGLRARPGDLEQVPGVGRAQEPERVGEPGGDQARTHEDYDAAPGAHLDRRDVAVVRRELGVVNSVDRHLKPGIGAAGDHHVEHLPGQCRQYARGPVGYVSLAAVDQRLPPAVNQHGRGKMQIGQSRDAHEGDPARQRADNRPGTAGRRQLHLQPCRLGHQGPVRRSEIDANDTVSCHGTALSGYNTP